VLSDSERARVTSLPARSLCICTMFKHTRTHAEGLRHRFAGYRARDPREPVRNAGTRQRDPELPS